MEEKEYQSIPNSKAEEFLSNHFNKLSEYPVTPDECYSKTSTKIERPKEILIKLRKSKKNKLKF